LEFLPGHLYGGTEKIHEDTQRSPTEILIGFNPNTNALMSEANGCVYIVHRHKFRKIPPKNDEKRL